MSKLRLCSHTLEIERGRYNKPKETPREERHCLYCKAHGNNIVEDEKHFLLYCPMSNELREKYLPQTLCQSNIRDDEKIIQILKTIDPKTTAKFIYRAFQNRETTLVVLSTIQDLTTEAISLSKKNTTDTYEIKHISDNGMKMSLKKVDPNVYKISS